MRDLGGMIVLLRYEEFRRLQESLEEMEDRKVQEVFMRASRASAVAIMKEDNARTMYPMVADRDPEDWEDAANYEDKP
jgi:hypothetical protein